MAIWNYFKDFMTGAAGIVVYYTAKASARIVNCHKKRVQIEPTIKNKIVSIFPTIDINKVRIIKNATLPANWFERPKRTDGMTFGRNIYIKDKSLQFDQGGIRLLLHELIHVKQISEFGECKFAARYGKEFVKFGYYNMPLEKEAYDFASKIRFE